MSAALAIGGISSPSEPPVRERQLSAAMRVTSPAASVDRMKNGPRNRAHTAVNSAPAHAASTAPASKPIHGGTPELKSRMVEVEAPRPKKAAWPNEIKPA